jgi:hypothetical protein
MNKLTIVLISFFLAINFYNCKNDKQAEAGINNDKPADSPNAGKSVPTISKSDSTNDPLLVQLPSSYYRPQGLRQLNVMEMFKFGNENPTKVRTLPLKDKNGNPVTYHIMENPEKPMFMQMYVNDSNRVVEGVVFEMNDEIKSLITKVRIVSSGN